MHMSGESELRRSPIRPRSIGFYRRPNHGTEREQQQFLHVPGGWFLCLRVPAKSFRSISWAP